MGAAWLLRRGRERRGKGGEVKRREGKGARARARARAGGGWGRPGLSFSHSHAPPAGVAAACATTATSWAAQPPAARARPAARRIRVGCMGRGGQRRRGGACEGAAAASARARGGEGNTRPRAARPGRGSSLRHPPPAVRPSCSSFQLTRERGGKEGGGGARAVGRRGGRFDLSRQRREFEGASAHRWRRLFSFRFSFLRTARTAAA